MVVKNGGKNSGRDNPPGNLDVYFTAEALSTRSKEFLTKTYSELCELRVSVVNLSFFFGLA